MQFEKKYRMYPVIYSQIKENYLSNTFYQKTKINKTKKKKSLCAFFKKGGQTLT